MHFVVFLVHVFVLSCPLPRSCTKLAHPHVDIDRSIHKPQCSFCVEQVQDLYQDQLLEPCHRLHSQVLLCVSNILRARMKNNLAAMRLLSPRKAEADGRSRTTTEGLREPFDSRLSKLPGYVNYTLPFPSLDKSDIAWFPAPSVTLSIRRLECPAQATNLVVRNS